MIGLILRSTGWGTGWTSARWRLVRKRPGGDWAMSPAASERPGIGLPEYWLARLAKGPWRRPPDGVSGRLYGIGTVCLR